MKSWPGLDWGLPATGLLSLPVSQAAGRRSRQVFEAEPVEGVWSVWGDWSECTQTCGVGVSQRSRKCLPPPPPQAPPYSPPLPTGRVTCPGHRGSGYLTHQPLLPSASSSIRPGQFGYGRVPFSVPLHRQNRQAPPRRAGQEQGASPTLSLLALLHPARPERPPRFDWHSVTAPPPPVPPLSRPHSPASARLSPLLSTAPAPAQGQGTPPGLRPPGPAGGRRLPSTPPAPPPPRGGAGQGRTQRSSSGVRRRRVDSRAEQCAAFNTQEFMGRLYNWEPFTEVGADKQCELTCRPAGYRFYVRQAERVRDGTPCFNVSANDVCVEGRCLTEGCDGVLGSGSVIDKCGVCGGRETSCRKVTGSFQNVTVPLGYHKILDIPPGATFINITERRASSNYLAMRSGTGVSVVNGRWAVDPPGEYPAGGTTFTYARPRAQVEGEEERGESLKAPGPTTAQLQLYVSTGPQEGIYFYPVSPLTVSIENPPPAPPPVSIPSFPSTSVFSPPSSDRWTPERLRPRGSAPNRNARIPPRTDLPLDTDPPFVWRRGGLTECSASCGKGQTFKIFILCISRHTDEEVPDRKCDSAAKPVPEEEPCNTHPCPPFWEASAWSECSVSCGSGVQQRQLQCRQSFGDRSTMVHPQRCAGLTPPESVQSCQLRLCSHWEVSSDWSTCSVDCGIGRRTRGVRCVSDQGSIVNDVECNSRLRPQGTEECNMGPCVTNWYFTAWSDTCLAQCGPGVQRREVVCLTRGGVREGGGGGDCVGEKPAEMKACNGGPCVATTTWYSSPWTQCNVPCGNGTQRRDIICVQKMAADFTVVPASECAHLDKPSAVQECEMGECRPQWFTTEWSACSQSCGKGLQMREVRCLTQDKKHSFDCDPSNKPEQEQICNIIPCSPRVPDENCRDRRHNCMMVVQARLCVYSYYKTACCASCAQSAQRAKRH
uniref:PLAC domain-containing protein n=1 Tax=Salarias fasciatus TaxID=181472 RepID=A0A672G1J2_SALFA